MCCIVVRYNSLQIISFKKVSLYIERSFNIIINEVENIKKMLLKETDSKLRKRKRSKKKKSRKWKNRRRGNEGVCN